MQLNQFLLLLDLFILHAHFSSWVYSAHTSHLDTPYYH